MCSDLYVGKLASLAIDCAGLRNFKSDRLLGFPPSPTMLNQPKISGADLEPPDLFESGPEPSCIPLCSIYSRVVRP